MQYPIDFPSRAVASERLVLNRRQQATESPLSYALQVVQTSSQWTLEFAWPRVSVLSAEVLRAFLMSLKGQIGTFRYYPRQAVASSLTGMKLASAVGGYQDTISVAGFMANGATSLRAGQYFQIGTQLLSILDAPKTADANGYATIAIAPEIRKAYAANEPVIFQRPCGLFRLATSDGLGFTLDPDLVPDLGTIQAREVVS